MRITAFLAGAVLSLSVWVGVAQAAGPSPGQGPWLPCPNNSPICASALGPDLDPSDQDFDCLTRNGRLGVALQNGNSARVHCWAT